MDRRKYYNSMHCVIKVTNSTRTKIDPLCVMSLQHVRQVKKLNYIILSE